MGALPSAHAAAELFGSAEGTLTGTDRQRIGCFARADGGFGSLAAVKLMLSSDPVLLAGWVHYLAFDLLIGRWIAFDAVKKGISQWFVAPCLFLTLMAGPVGFLLYSVFKGGMKKTISWEE